MTMPQPLDQVAQMSTGQIAILVALIAFPSAAIAAIVTGIFGIIQGRASRRSEELRMKQTLEAENRRQAADLAVQLALEDWKLRCQDAIKRHELECLQAAREGRVNRPPYQGPRLEQSVGAMMKAVQKIIQKGHADD